MKTQSRIKTQPLFRLVVAFGIFLAALVQFLSTQALGTPSPNAASIETRTFNSCPLSILTVTNNYPTSIEITDVMHPACVGFANLHSWSFSEDGGVTAAVFNNNSNFRFGADVEINGPGEGEGGLRISPWFSQFADGRFMVNASTGEIAAFGGALPFYSFTTSHGINYIKGTMIHLEMTYQANDLVSSDPATIQYRVIYNGNTYDSGVLLFAEQNPLECNPYGLWGMRNDGRVGGYFQPRANTGVDLTAMWSNIEFQELPAVGTPVANGASIETRTFDNCPLSTLTVSNNYPASIQITDEMDPACVGFANLHSWSFSEDGGVTAAVFNNNSNFRFGADFKIEGPGQGLGGLRISPWYAKFVDGRFEVNATTGEIACFGGALPFYSFTVNHGINYIKGTTIHLEMTYQANDLVSTDPATIQYRVIYNGNTYDSPVLPFGEGNPAECNPYGLWGMRNDGRVGGYFQPRANTGAALTGMWSNITYSSLDLLDDTAPIITCPENITQGNDPGQCGALVTYPPPTVTDDSPVTVTCSPASGSFFPIGTSTVTCTATDAASNTSECTFTVTVTGGNRCPLGEGYWKTHPEAWPLTSLVLGGKLYTKPELLAILGSPTTGDASLILARQLIAAILNQANGSNPEPVCEAISEANSLLNSPTARLPANIKPSSALGKSMTRVANQLDRYNGGLLTPGCTP